MKRSLSLLLAAVLLLGLLPSTVFAGGGAEELIWSQNFDAANALDGWTILDANHDGYSFALNGSGAVSGGRVIGATNGQSLAASDDYLVSPPITLREGEDVLQFSYFGAGMQDVLFEVYVYTGAAALDEGNPALLLGEPILDGAWIYFNGVDWATWTLDLTAYAGQSVRLVFRQHCENASALLLDELRVYWSEPDELLDKVTALSVPEPAVGKCVADCAESAIRFPESANYALIPGSLRYYRSEDEQMFEFNGTFTEGEEYSLSFEVMTKPGNSVSERGLASVNGKWALYQSESSEVVKVTRYFRRLSKTLDAVAVTTPAPLALREYSAEAAVADSSRCTIEQLACVPLYADGSTGEALAPGDCFERSQAYRFMVLLEPAAGWRFTGDTAVTVNGRAARFMATFETTYIYYIDLIPDHVLFTDVPEGLWYVDAVVYCCERGYMAGTGSGQFSPDAAFTRAMFVTVLAKLDGADISDYTGSSFNDVPEGEWYSKPVEWAWQHGYTSGTGDGAFSPNAGVTREMLAVFLYSYTKQKTGLDDEDWADLSAYPDGDEVSGWARNAMAWAVYEGLISGSNVGGTTYLLPGQTATRAQVAQIVMKYMEYLT